jgi:hypothetical protein
MPTDSFDEDGKQIERDERSMDS